MRSLRALGKTILLTTHYLDEAQQLADRVAVIRDGRIVKQGSPAELIGVGPEGRDPLPRGRPRRRDRDRRADPRARRADRRRGRGGPRARGARGRAPLARGRLPRPDRQRRRRTREAASATSCATSSGCSGATASRRSSSSSSRRCCSCCSARSTTGEIEGFQAGRRPARRPDRLRVRQHRVRGARDHARDPPRERRPQAHPRDAAAHGRPTSPRCSSRRCSSSCCRRSLTIALGLSLYGAKGPENWLGMIPAVLVGVACFAGMGFGATAADPLGRGRVGRRQPDRAPDGVPLRLVRADAQATPRCCSGSPTSCR